MKQLLSVNCKREEYGIQKSKVGVLGASVELVNVFA
jgi:hypothetical protein